MPLSRHLLFSLLVFFVIPVSAQTTAPATTNDPQAVAIVQTAITALGGAPAIGQSNRWAFQGQTEGDFQNGSKSETLDATVTQTQALSPGGSPPPRVPVWVTPRSPFIPALVGSILVRESQSPTFSMELQTSPSIDGISVVVFSVPTTGGRRIPAQFWYFDKTTGLPKRISFTAAARIGQVESLSNADALLSDYRAVGGVLYPYHIETLLQRTQERKVITLQGVTPSAATGGAQ